MNIYDTANTLAAEIKQSEEYTIFKKAKEELNAEPELKQRVDEFEKMKYEVQLQTIQSGNTAQEKMAQMQEMFSKLMESEKVKVYLDAEYKFNVLMVDINKIISEVVKDLIQ